MLNRNDKRISDISKSDSLYYANETKIQNKDHVDFSVNKQLF